MRINNGPTVLCDICGRRPSTHSVRCNETIYRICDAEKCMCIAGELCKEDLDEEASEWQHNPN